MARTKRLRILKDPQCRHKDQFLTYSAYGLGLLTVTCSNCGSTSEPQADRESARLSLMRIEAPPLVP